MWQSKDNKLLYQGDFKNFAAGFEFIKYIVASIGSISRYPVWQQDGGVVRLWIDHDDQVLKKAIEDCVGSLNLGAKSPKNTTSKSTSLIEVKLFTDGGSRGNPGPSAAAYVVLTTDDQEIEKAGYYIGLTTNNQAEYQALKHGLERVKALGARKVHVYMDSLLVVNQMKGLFKVKNRDLWPIYQNVKDFCKNFSSVNFTHVPRELNKSADQEVNRILDEM